MDRLDGQVALVTGASQGIGLEIARTLAAHGAITILNGRNDLKLAGPVVEIARKGGIAEAAAFDVTQEQAVDEAITNIATRFGRLDILVNNAGIMRKLDVFQTTLTDWDIALKTNLTGAFLCSRAALRVMRGQKAGRIIMIGSTAGQRGSPAGIVSYSAAKAGLTGLAQTLAFTTAQFGVTVNVVAPGMIDTEMLRAGFGGQLADAAGAVPLGLGQPQDVADAVLYLSSQTGRYITGATLDVNGGLYLR